MESSLAVIIAIKLQSPYEYLVTVLLEGLLFCIAYKVATSLVEYRIHSFKSLFTLAMYEVKHLL